MASTDPGWIVMKFDQVSIKNQLKNGLTSSSLDLIAPKASTPYAYSSLSDFETSESFQALRI